MEAIRTFEHHGCTVEIHHDEDGESPRTAWDNFGKMVCFHSRYDLGDGDKMSADDLREIVAAPGVISLPLYLYDHSGISMSARKVYPYNDEWDSGCVGMIYATPEMIREEYKAETITPELAEDVTARLMAEVETYDQFLRGEVYGYTVTRNGEEDSCWGYYGMTDAIDAAKDAAASMFEHQERERQDRLKAKIRNRAPLEAR